jgi:hypothetical protein
MNHDGADHAAAGAEARFDVTDVLQRQRTRGLWDGGAVSVTSPPLAPPEARSRLLIIAVIALR